MCHGENFGVGADTVNFSRVFVASSRLPNVFAGTNKKARMSYLRVYSVNPVHLTTLVFLLHVAKMVSETFLFGLVGEMGLSLFC